MEINFIMVEIKLGQTNIFYPLPDNLDGFADAFVSVLGQRHKNKIKSALNNTKFVFCGANDVLIENAVKIQWQHEVDQLDKNNPDHKHQLEAIDKKYQAYIDTLQKNAKVMAILDRKFYKQRLDAANRQIDKIQQQNNFDFNQKSSNALAEIYVDLLAIDNQKLVQHLKLLSGEEQQKVENLFLMLGYQKCKNFDDYLQDHILINQVFCQDIYDQFEQILQNHKEEYCDKNIFVKQALNFVEQNGLDNPKVFEAIELLAFGSTDTSALELSFVNSKKQLQNVCFCKNLCELALGDLVHEMGHAIDANVVNVGQIVSSYKSGFALYLTANFFEENQQDLANDEIENFFVPQYDNLEQFNEIFNEYITQSVTAEFKKNNPNFCKQFGVDVGESAYCNAFPIFKNLFKTHFEQLVDFKMAKDWKQAEQYFGAENLQYFAKAANAYMDFVCMSAGIKDADGQLAKKQKNLCKMYKQIVDNISAQIELKHSCSL